MSKAVNHIPDGYRSVTPYLYIDGAAAAIDYYKKVFGATEVVRMPNPDGKIAHAELVIGGSHVMLADQNEKINAYSPKHYGGTPGCILLYVEDVDAVFNKAIDAGAKVERPVADQFYGDRTGGVEDPFGHHWYIATHVRDVTPEEMKEAMAGATT